MQKPTRNLKGRILNHLLLGLNISRMEVFPYWEYVCTERALAFLKSLTLKELIKLSYRKSRIWLGGTRDADLDGTLFTQRLDLNKVDSFFPKETILSIQYWFRLWNWGKKKVLGIDANLWLERIKNKVNFVNFNYPSLPRNYYVQWILCFDEKGKWQKYPLKAIDYGKPNKTVFTRKNKNIRVFNNTRSSLLPSLEVLFSNALKREFKKPNIAKILVESVKKYKESCK